VRRGVPFLVDGGVGTGRTDGIGADAAVVLPVEAAELEEAHLALGLLPVVLLVLQTQV
jgi:hypothetical protein